MDKGIYKKPTLYKRRREEEKGSPPLLRLVPPQKEKCSPSLWRLPVGEAKQGDATQSPWTN